MKFLKKMMRKLETQPVMRSKLDLHGVPLNIAHPIMDESFSPEILRSTSAYSDAELRVYCKSLLDAEAITEERYRSIVDDERNTG